MWQLTCESDLFDGKAIWLRPGSRHLLGRTSSRSEKGERIRYIDHKNVSRKHLLLEVSTVGKGQSSQIHQRTIVSATDNSKTGTYVNGKKVVKQQVDLDRTENKLQLGISEFIFHIKWVPVVLTCTNISKSLKASDDPLASFRMQLEQTDIKLLTTYVSNVTTHVIASKRNNPAVLQALGQAKWTVSYAWLDMLTGATRLPGAGEEDDLHLSPLESDLPGAWPKESEYLVDPGSEPVPREKALLLPNPQRSEIFDGLSFVFILQSQYDNLMPVVTACGGKAFERDTSEETNDVSDIVSFVKQLANEKKSARNDKRGVEKVVVIRPSGKKEQETHWSRLNEVLTQALGRATLAQNEFLDIILTLDKTKLGPAAANMGGDHAEQQRRDQSFDNQQTDGTSRAHSLKPVIKSRFQGFQDFDPSQIVRPASSSSNDSASNQAMSLHSEDEGTQARSVPPANTISQKRKANTQEPGDRDEALDMEFPGMAAMKKRRIEHGTRSPSDEADAAGVDTKGSARQSLDVQEIKSKLQAQLQQAEKDQAEQDEKLKAQLHDLDLEQYKDCAQVEEYEVKLRITEKPGTVTERRAASDWNPAWNGRKNFKAFRPQGQAQERMKRPRVFVQLVEASKEAYDASDLTWADNMDSSMPDHHSEQLSAETTSPVFTHSRPSQSQNTSDSGRLALSGSPRGLANHSMITETPGGTSTKRHASDQRGGPSKKHRPNGSSSRSNVYTGVEDDEDDDEDGLQFRRKRR